MNSSSCAQATTRATLHLRVAGETNSALQIQRSHRLHTQACLIRHETDEASALVTMRSRISAARIVHMFPGEQLHRLSELQSQEVKGRLSSLTEAAFSGPQFR